MNWSSLEIWVTRNRIAFLFDSSKYDSNKEELYRQLEIHINDYNNNQTML